MIKLGVKLDNRFKKQLKARYEGYTVEAGVLQDRPYKAPRPKSAGLGSLLGGPVRKKSKNERGKVSEVSERIRKDGNDIYVAPVKKFRSADMRKFMKVFGLFIQGKVQRSKVETALRAVIRNPILRGSYGRNAASTVRSKGFQRFLIDTGQLFRTIAAKVRTTRVQKRS